MKLNTIKLIAFLLPFELPLSYIMHGVLKPFLGEFYRLGFNGFWGSILLILLFSTVQVVKKRFDFLFIAFLFIATGFWEYLNTLLLDGFVGEAFSQFVCGFLFPSLLFSFLIVSPEGVSKHFFKYWYIGTMCVLLVGYLATIYYYSSLPDWFKDKDPAFKLISFRYAYEGDASSNGMMLILGNFNKESNYLIMMLLASVWIFGYSEKNKKLVLWFWIITVATLLVLFSRLVLLLLPFVYYFSGVRQYLKGTIKAKYLYVPAIIFILIYGIKYSEFIMPTLEYLVYSKFDDNSDQLGLLGTGNNRFQAWSLLTDKFKDLNIWMNGMGVGQYGIEHAGSKDAGTHNLLLDHLFASGFWVPVLVLMICFYTFLKGYMKRDNIIMVSIPIVLLLFVREYSFSYLFVTAQGGVVFILLLYMACMPKSSELDIKNKVLK